MSKNRGQQHYNVSMEDFNDNVGKTVAQKTSLGPHGVDLRMQENTQLLTLPKIIYLKL